MNFSNSAELLEVAASAVDPKQRIVACDMLVRIGLFDEAEAHLQALTETAATGAEARKLLAVCRQLRRWGIVGQLERYRTIAGPDAGLPDFSGESGFLMARRPNAKKIIFVFTGNARQIWVSLHMLHQLLPDDCHVIYLKDNRTAGYLFGIEELADDYAGTVAALRRVIASLGGLPVYCLGSSGGGYASLRYAMDLGALAVLAFTPATDASSLNLLPDFTGLGRLTAGAAVDIRTFYAEAKNPPRVSLVFGDAEPNDAAACRRLAELATVTLHPIPGYDRHDAVSHTMATGTFRAFVDALLAVQAAPAARPWGLAWLGGWRGAINRLRPS